MQDSNEFSYVEVDEHRLDEEWVAQPRNYLKAAMRAADARQEHSETKANLEVVEAELSMEIREDPVQFNLPKATEASIESCIKTQPRYKDALKEVIVSKHALDIREAVVTALDHKKKALENLTQLNGRNYFSAPTAPEGHKERLETTGKQSARNKAGKRLNNDHN